MIKYFFYNLIIFAKTIKDINSIFFICVIETSYFLIIVLLGNVITYIQKFTDWESVFTILVIVHMLNYYINREIQITLIHIRKKEFNRGEFR